MAPLVCSGDSKSYGAFLTPELVRYNGVDLSLFEGSDYATERERLSTVS